MPEVFGNEVWFNEHVTFYKNFTIGGEIDNLSVKTLNVGGSITSLEPIVFDSDVNISGSITVDDITVTGKLNDGNNSFGEAGQVLSSDGTNLIWIDIIQSEQSLTVTAKTAAYTLVGGDVNSVISITTGGITVPSGVFIPGDTVLIYNNSAASQTITQGASTTLRLPGTADTGDRTLQQRGLATVLCIAANEFLITGSGLL